MCVSLHRRWQRGLMAGSLGLGSLMFGSVAFAEGVPITPGLWEITTHNSMLGTQEVQQSCMKQDVFDPLSLMGEEEGCDILNEVVSGNSVNYDVVCVDDQEAGKAEGHFAFTIDGDKGNGQVDMTMTVGDQSFNMKFSMDAERLGDC